MSMIITAKIFRMTWTFPKIQNFSLYWQPKSKLTTKFLFLCWRLPLKRNMKKDIPEICFQGKLLLPLKEQCSQLKIPTFVTPLQISTISKAWLLSISHFSYCFRRESVTSGDILLEPHSLTDHNMNVTVDHIAMGLKRPFKSFSMVQLRSRENTRVAGSLQVESLKESITIPLSRSTNHESGIDQ